MDADREQRLRRLRDWLVEGRSRTLTIADAALLVEALEERQHFEQMAEEALAEAYQAAEARIQQLEEALRQIRLLTEPFTEAEEPHENRD